MESKRNICLYDWFSFTHPLLHHSDVIKMLGMQHCNWVPKERGRYGYPSGIYCGSISIFYGSAGDGRGVFCDLSGQGCRMFESESSVTWFDLFSSVISFDCNVTRLDLAFDDHTRILDIVQCEQDLRSGEYVSKAKKVSVEWSLDQTTNIQGRSLYIGSPASNCMIRIYDKAAERGILNEHWIRVEIQLRHECAMGYVVNCGNLPSGSSFAGVLLNYLRFVDPGEDTNRWRWPMKKYWCDLVGAADAIRVYSNPGVEYNESRVKRFVFQHAGNAIDTCLQLYGEAAFFQMLQDRGVKPNPKYADLIADVEAERRERESVIRDRLRSVPGVPEALEKFRRGNELRIEEQLRLFPNIPLPF